MSAVDDDPIPDWMIHGDDAPEWGEPPVTADHTPERLSAEERGIRDLTLAIMHFYGYTDADIAEAEAVHPGLVCREEECYDEDGKSVHPGAYDELGGTASTVVEVIWPWVAAHLADVEARLAAVEALDDDICAALMAAKHGSYDGKPVERHLERLLDKFRTALSAVARDE